MGPLCLAGQRGLFFFWIRGGFGTSAGAKKRGPAEKLLQRVQSVLVGASRVSDEVIVKPITSKITPPANLGGNPSLIDAHLSITTQKALFANLCGNPTKINVFSIFH